jgi:hypothetical protein
MLENFKARGAFSFFAAAFLLYAALYFLVPISILAQLVNGVFLALSAALLITLIPLFSDSLVRRKFDEVSMLVVGSFIVWPAAIYQTMISIWMWSAGKPPALPFLPHAALARYVFICALLLLITALGDPDGRWRRNKMLMAVAITFGLCVGAAAIWIQRQGA